MKIAHSVAFRVTEAQWLKLQQIAQQEETSIPQLAKSVLFESVGIKTESKRRRYGQILNTKTYSERETG
jgi:hypothetical protein